MDLYLYNSLTRKKEKFVPIDSHGQARGTHPLRQAELDENIKDSTTSKAVVFSNLGINPPNVGLYTCGPTVYGPSHIGHARSYVAFDILKRVLAFNGYKVNHVMNITDVHDSIIKEASRLNVSVEELSNKYIHLLHMDIGDMNCLPANYYPKVTENIEGIIEMIKILIDKGYAYVEGDGSVYYRVSQFGEYGKLSGILVEQEKAGTRVSTDKYEREEAVDFALWKGAKEGEQSWDSPWGRGRPGWHIECSAMSKKFLGSTFDIHAGGVDIKFPHHENEIAQSEAANGKPFVKYWVHPGLLDVDNVKMSRSLGNVYSLRDIEEKGFSALDFRYLTFLTHYRSKMSFSWEALSAAQTAYRRLLSFTQNGILPNRDTPDSGVSRIEEYNAAFPNIINNDFDMPGVLALVWKLIKDEKVSREERVGLLMKWDEVLGLKLKSQKSKVKSEGQKLKVQIPKEIREMMEEREDLRRQKKFDEADKLRVEIEKRGFKVEDTEKGSKLSSLT